MAIPSRQIGWGTESNLLWQILKQLNKLTSVLFALKQSNNPSNYKVYTALLSQSGELAPVAIVLENTLGETPVWNRDGIGSYKMVTVGDVFKVDKTVSFIGHNYDTPSAIWQFGRADGTGPLIEKAVWLTVYSNLYDTPIDISSGGSTYYDTYVEVRVYN